MNGTPININPDLITIDEIVSASHACYLDLKSINELNNKVFAIYEIADFPGHFMILFDDGFIEFIQHFKGDIHAEEKICVKTKDINREHTHTREHITCIRTGSN